MMSGILTFSVTIFNKFNGISLVDATTILTSYVIAGSVGLITGGILADKWNRHTLTAVVALLVSAVLLAVIEAFSLPIILLTLALVVIGFLQATIRPARDMIVRSIIPKNSIGKVFGFLSAAMSAGHAIAPVFVGWLIDRGNHDIVFYVLAAIMLLAIPTITLAQSPAILRGLEAGTETAAEKSAAE